MPCCKQSEASAMEPANELVAIHQKSRTQARLEQSNCSRLQAFGGRRSQRIGMRVSTTRQKADAQAAGAKDCNGSNLDARAEPKRSFKRTCNCGFGRVTGQRGTAAFGLDISSATTFDSGGHSTVRRQRLHPV